MWDGVLALFFKNFYFKFQMISTIFWYKKAQLEFANDVFIVLGLGIPLSICLVNEVSIIRFTEGKFSVIWNLLKYCKPSIKGFVMKFKIIFFLEISSDLQPMVILIIIFGVISISLHLALVAISGHNCRYLTLWVKVCVYTIHNLNSDKLRILE